MADSLDEVKRRILTRVNLATLLGEKIALINRSGKLVACCPFHAEKSPSFYLYDDHYHCFGCKQHGDAIDWVRETEGLSFVESLRFLAKKFGIEAPELDESTGRLKRARQDAALFQIMVEAQRFFAANLKSDEGEPARRYLLERGFTAESIEDFGFGATPREPFGLVKHLRAQGFRGDDMVTLALATASAKDGRPYDFFRGRVMLPIHDAQGRVIAFGGRTLDGAQPKYLNSRDTPLFAKSTMLFGFDRARKKMREKGRAIIVEGYMDALMLWQTGFGEAVASLGTAFGEAHLKLLRNATSQAVLLFDGDQAGQRATLHAVSVALSVPEVNLRTTVLPDGDDPDSFVLKHGAAALEAKLADATGLLDFAIAEKLKTTHHLAIPDMVQKELVPWLARVPERMQQSYLAGRIAALTGIPQRTIEAQLRDAHQAELVASGLPRRHGAETKTTPPPPPIVIKPLDALGFDYFGQIFFSTPTELDPKAVTEFALKELELDDAHQLLLDEMLIVLSQGTTPAADPRFRLDSGGAGADEPRRQGQDGILSLAEPVIVSLVERLQKSAAAFAGGNRQDRMNRVIAAFRTRRVKAQVQDLKAQLARLSALPGTADEVSQILKTIGELSRSPIPAASSGGGL